MKLTKKLKYLYFAIIIVLLFLLSLFLLNYSYKKSDLQQKTLIKSNFNLVDQYGKPISSKTFHGKFTLIFFGFTYCPDICPNTLNKIALAYDLLENEIQKNLKVIFITVDPNRDTPEVLKEYIGVFNPDFIALTGHAEKIKEASESMGVFYKKSQKDDLTNDYLINHSSIKFLMDPKGEYLSHYSRELSHSDLAKKINKKIREYKSRD
tara:strand:+ start:116 stop:739 length:624 start_codon:yes stop_codon:yes gene_type:complete